MYQSWKKVYGQTQSSGSGFVVPATAPSSTLLNNLVASWKLDDLTDQVNGHTLTNNNTVTFNTGKLGNAAYFSSASSQYLSLASNADVQLGDIDWTIGAWVYLTNNDADLSIVAKDNETAGNREYNIYYSGTNGNFRALAFVATDTAITPAIATNFGAASTGTWYCVLAWWETATNTLYISVNDGTPNSSAAGNNLQAAGTAPFRIGASAYTGFESYFNGRIDNVNIWKRVLTAGERTEFYNSGTGKEYPFS